MTLRDDNSTAQIQRMINALEGFYNSWIATEHAWHDLERECQYLLEMSMQEPYFAMKQFMNRYHVNRKYDVGYLTEAARKLEKELVIMKKELQ